MLPKISLTFFGFSFLLISISCKSIAPVVGEDRGTKTAGFQSPTTFSIPDTANVSLEVSDSERLLKPEEFILKYDRVAEIAPPLSQGRASWYGPNFQGRLTASGEAFDMHGRTAAHPSLPFNTLVWVENKHNGRGVLVRINDRGPYANDRVIDLSKSAARALDMIGHGVTNVQLFIVKKGSGQNTGTNDSDLYTIQLGIFTKGAKAFDYANKLEGTRVEIIHEHSQKYYGVFYGQYVDREEALKKKEELAHQNFAGHVKRFETG